MANLRWPLRATRNFSATPRRRWFGRGTRQRAAAKAIVRKAGPQDRHFFASSTLEDLASPTASTYKSTGSGGVTQHDIITVPDYQQQVISQERVLIKRISVTINAKATPLSTSVNWRAYSKVTFMLVRGRAEDIDEQFATFLASPSRTLADALAYQDLTRNVRVLLRRDVIFSHPNEPQNVSNTEEALNSISNATPGVFRMFTLRVKKPFWLREPEVVSLVCNSYVPYVLGGTTSNVPQVNGHHQWMVTFAKY